MAPFEERAGSERRAVRYAVVGLGHIAQTTVLPAFASAQRNSRLVALVSGDRAKLRDLARAYQVPHTFTYDQYDACLALPEVDAVYIALPNHLHAEYAVRAARAGVHVLCEKPMALNEQECRAMISAADEARVKLMVAYRLHFEESNMHACELARSGALGRPRVFDSTFSYQVRPGNIRLQRVKGGGPLWDIGIYCVNAARYLFRSEPEEVFAFAAEGGDDERFREVEEGIGAVMRFPGEAMATFVCSYGSAATSNYRLVGSEGSLQLDNAYEYQGERTLTFTLGNNTRQTSFPEVDQFAPQLLYFSDCIFQDADPEPDGEEGLADVRIIRALYHSSAIDKPVGLEPFERKRHPELAMADRRAPVSPQAVVEVSPPVTE